MAKKITLRVDSTCGMAEAVKKAILEDDAPKEAVFSENTINNIPGRFGVYLGNKDDNTYRIGVIADIDGAKPTDADIRGLIAIGAPITFLKAEDKFIYCEVEMETTPVATAPKPRTKAKATKKVSSPKVKKMENGWKEPNGLPYPIPITSVNEMAEEIVKRGYSEEENLESVLDVFEANKFSFELQCLILSHYRTYLNPCVRPKTVYFDPELEEDIRKYGEGKLARACRAAIFGLPVVCQGPKACGKNAFMETVAWLLGQPWYLLSFNRQMNQVSFFGEKTTDNSAQDLLREFDEKKLSLGKQASEIRARIIEYGLKNNEPAEKIEEVLDAALSKEQKQALNDLAKFEKAKALAATTNIVQERSVFVDCLTDGGVMIFNEMNMIDSNTFSAIANPLCDGTGKLLVPGKGEVPIHKDFHLFGTQNEDYEGVEDPNAATISRFKAITFQQPKNVLEILTRSAVAEVEKAGFDYEEMTKLPSWRNKKECFIQATSFYKQCLGTVGEEITDSVLNIRGFARALALFICDTGNTTRLSGLLDEGVIQTCPSDERLALGAALQTCVTL